MDIIKVNGIRLYAYHGVLQAERDIGQYFIVDVALYTDLSDAGFSDDVNDTINYAEVYESIETIVQGPPVNLLEHLGHKIIEKLMNDYPVVKKIEVTITKPSPPIEGNYKDVSVTLNREVKDRK